LQQLADCVEGNRRHSAENMENGQVTRGAMFHLDFSQAFGYGGAWLLLCKL
jgi:hypothetical protein